MNVLLNWLSLIAVVIAIFPTHLSSHAYTSSLLGNYSTAAVASDAAQCAEVGKDILGKNGSAVDSAIATLLCMGVVTPQSMGLGGGFFMVIYDRSSQSVKVLDARETAPSGATEDMFGGDPEKSTIGGLSIAVPSSIPGFIEAHEAYGKLEWQDLFTSALNFSKHGFTISAHLERAIDVNLNRLKNFHHTRDLLTNPVTKQYYREGEIMKNQLLYETLQKIANDPQAWYEDMADDLANDIREAGGIVSSDDLRSYLPAWKVATESNIASQFKLYSVPPPGSGAVLSFVLNVMQNFNLSPQSIATLNATILTSHRLVETFKFAYARRMELADLLYSDSSYQAFDDLTSNDYANYVTQKILDNGTSYDPSYYGVRMYQDDDSGTAHLAIIAPNGDAVSVTSSINAYFGSKVLSKTTGIILNNQMDDFSSPDITNIYGVPPSRPNYIAPGKRPQSSMCPSIIVDSNGDVKLVLGAEGGTMITTAVAQVILKTMFFGMNVKEAIDDPRIHHQLFPNYISYEKEFSQDILEGLVKMGHKTKELDELGGIVQAILRAGEDGRLYANYDNRKGGSVDGF